VFFIYKWVRLEGKRFILVRINWFPDHQNSSVDKRMLCAQVAEIYLLGVIHTVPLTDTEEPLHVCLSQTWKERNWDGLRLKNSKKFIKHRNP
jgi:hypothetical protein